MASLLNVLIGEYRIVESLGAGGMGEVYKAVHTHLGRVIAIKVLSPDLADGPALRRFYSEATIQGSLKHPGVAEYLGFYEYQGRPCILMEYVDGDTLATLIERRGPLPVEEAVRVVREIAQVAGQFHAQGVVHRDLKTSNVKVTVAGKIKVLDFGIARHQKSDRLTRVGAVIGTPDSLAPEQVRGEPVGPSTDIWQIGVLFYELLTGKLPFQGSTTHDTWNRILSADFPPATRVRGDLPPEIDRILSRCLHKDIGRRYRSGLELGEALGALERKTWATPGAAPSTAARKRPNPAVIGVAGLAVVLGLGLIVHFSHGSADSSASGSATSAAQQTGQAVTVDSVNGPTQVYRNGKLLGTTPVQMRPPSGETVKLTLRREGYEDMDVQFDAGERRIYTFALRPLKEQR